MPEKTSVKYCSHFFLHLSYEELVNITEPQLEHLNITKVRNRQVGQYSKLKIRNIKYKILHRRQYKNQ